MQLRKRQRLAPSASDGRRRAASKRGTWFEKLPEEVCERLAAHVCRQEQNLDGLALAKTSPTLRKAVLAVLNHRLVIYDKTSLSRIRSAPKWGNWDTATIRKWVSMMGKDVLEVVQPFLITLGKRHPPRYTLALLALPNLRMAEITDHPAHLAAVSRSTSIREIMICFRGLVPSTEIFSTFSKLRLETLRTICPNEVEVGPSFQCPFLDRDVSDSDPNVISKSLPHLKAIEVSCACFEPGGMSYWNVLPSLKTLQEVSVMFGDSPDAIPEEAIRFLSTRDSVRIMETIHAHVLASAIGSAISEISQGRRVRFDPFTEEQVIDLENFPRLKKLCFTIIEGADKALPQAVEKLPELRVLDAVWVRSVDEARVPWKYAGARFATASPGTLLRTVQVAPQLSELCIGRVRIPLRELVGILGSVGRRLRVFCTSISHQEESPLDRLEALLLTAAKWNTELRSFLIVDVVLQRGAIRLEEWERQAERVLGRVQFFGKRAPYVDSARLRATMQELLVGE